MGPDSNIDVFINEDLIKNDLIDASGLTVFGLDCRDEESIPLIAFIVVMDFYGNIVNIHNPPNRAESVSMYDPDTVLFSIIGSADTGRLWNFRDDTVVILPFFPDQHSLVYDASSGLFFGLEKGDNYDASVCVAWDIQGYQRWRLPFPEGSSHINYLTVDGTFAYVSLRGQSAIVKMDIASGQEVMRVGGKEHLSSISVIDLDGRKSGNHDRDYIWHRQHRGEHLSDRYWSLFDNHVDAQGDSFVDNGNSHLMVLDVSQDPARVAFSYDTGDKTKIYGSADVVPSGNVLGVSWPNVVDPSRFDTNYHVNIWEVTPSYEIAWRLSFKGLNPFEPYDEMGAYIHTKTPEEEAPVGWVSYNTERIYSAPLISYPCRDDGMGGVHFMAFNSIRTQTDMLGGAFLMQGGQIISMVDVFLQKAFLPRQVFIPLNGASGEVTLVLSNNWMQTASVSLNLPALTSCVNMPPNGRIFYD